MLDTFWEVTHVLLNVHDYQFQPHNNVLIHAQTNTSTTHLMTFVSHVLMDVHYVQVNRIVYCGKVNLLILTIAYFMTKCNFGSSWLLLLLGWSDFLFGNLLLKNISLKILKITTILLAQIHQPHRSKKAKSHKKVHVPDKWTTSQINYGL